MTLDIGYNSNFKFDNIINSPIKYIFNFNFEVCYDEFENEEVIKKAIDDENDYNLINAINDDMTKNNIPCRVIKVIEMRDANGWPYVSINTITPMTVKEYIKFLDEYFEYSSSYKSKVSAENILKDYGITVVKICG